MRPYSLAHLSDANLLRELKSLVARDRATTAALLAHIAEVDARWLYAPAGHSSMFGYCVGELGLSEDVTYKRIMAARAARKFPVLFEYVADGRLHLTAIRFLAPHLTADNLEELLTSSVGMRSSEVEAMLAMRFGRPSEPTRIRAIADPVPVAIVQAGGRENADESSLFGQLVARPVDAPLEDAAANLPVAVTSAIESHPAAALRYRLEITIEEATHSKLRRAQGLLGHVIPSADLAQILDRALDALLAQVEKRKFAATSKPRTRASTDTRPRAFIRTIPAAVRRAVWERDGGLCTFVGDRGRRCQGRGFIEFDHAVPVAQGGLATIENLRLRCRTHNQFEAERRFGSAYVAGKRRRAAKKPNLTTRREGVPRVHDGPA